MIQNNVIRSDDPQAVEKLQAKLDKLTKQHARMKEINAYFKKHATALGCPGLSDAEAAKLDERVQNSYSWEKQPYITNAPAGCGLLRYGGALVPFKNQFPKDTELYRLMTTKPDESIIVGGNTK